MPSRAELLYPLGEFYARLGASLPEAVRVAGEDVPQPYQRLLVHHNDMTPTLEAFHAGPVHVRVLARQRDDGRYSRQVTLELNGSGRPVEFGAIVIYLNRFPEAAREDILAEVRPLGTILAAHRVQHTSAPSAFLRVTADATIEQALGLPAGSPGTLYGRRNVITNAAGEPLAEILEILPPAGEDAGR